MRYRCHFDRQPLWLLVVICSMALLLAGGCSSPPPASQPKAPGHRQYLESVNFGGVGWFHPPDGPWVIYEYSPDRAWKVQARKFLSSSIYVTKVNDPSSVMVISKPKGKVEAIQWGSWAPDSQSFLIYKSYPMPGCPTGGNIIIYSLDPQSNQFIRSGDTSEWNNDIECITTTWSPDGSKIAGIFDFRSIRIMDKHGQRIEDLYPKLIANQYVLEVWWDKTGLYALILVSQNRDSNQPVYKNPDYKLVRLDPDNGIEQQITPVDSTYFSFVGSSPDGEEVYILQWVDEAGEKDGWQFSRYALLTIRLDTSEIINRKPILLPRAIFRSSSISSDGNYIAMRFDYIILMLNRKRMEIVPCGKISRLSGWDEVNQGFQFTSVVEDRLLYGVVKPY
jgi:hypothetical protein